MPAKKRKSDAKGDDSATGASAPAAAAAATATGIPEEGHSAKPKYKQHTPCHMEIPAHDVNRVSKFYTEALGWKCTPYGAEYVVWATDGLGGGFFHTTAAIGQTKAPVMSVYSADVPATLIKIDAAGGVVTRCNTLISKEIGAWAGYRDTEGNEMSVYSERTDDVVAVQDIDQTVQLSLSPHDAYESFVDEKKHAAYTPGNKCSVDRRVNGAFSVSCGYITGRHIALEQDKKLVMAWRAQDWPAGHWSNLTLSFEAVEGDAAACVVRLQQTGVPVAKHKDIADGWFAYYWKPLKLAKDLTVRQYVYRPCSRAQYEQCKKLGRMPGCDEETKAGFITLLTPKQCMGAAGRHFAGNEMALMKINTAKLGFSFKWEKDGKDPAADPVPRYHKAAGTTEDVAVPMTAVEDCITIPWDAAKKVHVFPPTVV